MGIGRSFFRSMLLRSGTSGRRLSSLMISPEEMDEVRSMLIEASDSMASIMVKREELSCSQLVLMTGMLSAAMLKLVKDVYGKDMFSLFKSVADEQWAEIKDKNMT